VVAGYVSGKSADIKLRERAQLLAKQVLDVTSAGLGQYATFLEITAFGCIVSRTCY